MLSRFRRYSHCAAKLFTSASARVVGQHAAHLLLEHGGILEAPLHGRIEELIVGNAAPEKKRQPRGQLEIVDAIGIAG